MRYCNDCKAYVRDNTTLCPLCANSLELASTENTRKAYPSTKINRISYDIIKRSLIFLSVLSALSCVVANYLRPEKLWWSLIVVTSLAYAWAVIPHALRRGGNYAGKIFTQVVCGIALVVLLDIEISWSGWSVNFAVPVILCVGISAVGLVVMCNATNWARYVIYQLLLAFFGFVPIVLYFTGITQNWLFAVVTAGFAMTTLIAMVLFGDRSIKNEFKRRLRF